MNRIPLTCGRVARSMAGRDRGRLFAVSEEIDDDFVLAVNGGLRTLERPKKKRRKHLKALPFTVDVRAGITDAELRQALAAIDQQEEGNRKCPNPT
ncbi:MAG: KOW domain-containing RNA-binding protein [Clostridia bacterium]|nr:KOW domain-containing RNA-binding protein [Clostridia bacterium]